MKIEPIEASSADRRRVAWLITLAVFLPFGLVCIIVFTSSAEMPPPTWPGMEELHSGDQPKPKIMRKLDEQAMPMLSPLRIGARAVATLAGACIAIAAAARIAKSTDGETVEEITKPAQSIIRSSARYLLELVLVAFGFFFASMAGLIIFTLSQAPPPNAAVFEKIVYHIQGDVLYYSTFQFAEIIVFSGGILGLAIYRIARLINWKTIILILVPCLVLLAFNKAAYFVIPLIGYAACTLSIARSINT